ncbi:nuclear transport factor 2 family protein [Aldersonia kunmingensis]|uniref:nuclear transport factor 2 family protein n=1 Tax=Aldersonia kunmingensis TaxID=408066 RepID=UPI00083733E3|nr:nuclear transport factor 2 family protein [Aldersonia kunmingensis]
MSTSEIATVLAWHDALNDADFDTLLELSSDDVELGGPQGASQGLAALRDWASESGIRLVPGRLYYHDGVVVVEQDASWTASPGKTATIATAFRVVHDRVTSVYRHDDLATALSATDMTEGDLVPDS